MKSFVWTTLLIPAPSPRKAPRVADRHSPVVHPRGRMDLRLCAGAKPPRELCNFLARSRHPVPPLCRPGTPLFPSSCRGYVIRGHVRCRGWVRGSEAGQPPLADGSARRARIAGDVNLGVKKLSPLSEALSLAPRLRRGAQPRLAYMKNSCNIFRRWTTALMQVDWKGEPCTRHGKLGWLYYPRKMLREFCVSLVFDIRYREYLIR